MSQPALLTAEEPAPSNIAHASSKACDNCARRKIRCDKSVPCSHCVRVGTACVVSPRVQRQKRPRASVATEGGGRTSSVAERLEQIDRLVHGLVGDPNARARVNKRLTPASHTPSIASGSLAMHHHTSQAATPSSSNSNTQPPNPSNALPPSPEDNRIEDTAEDDDDDDAKEKDNGDIEAEGPSSLSAHSKFAADFIEGIVNMNEGETASGDTRGLLDDLNHRVLVVDENHRSLKYRLPSRSRGSSSTRRQKDMIPLDVALVLIRKGRAENGLVIQILDRLLPNTSLIDLCLDVYFATEFDRADFIIVNFTLHCLFREPHMMRKDGESCVESNRQYINTCASNMDKALAELPLFMPRAHRMVLALVVGVVFAMEQSKPSLGWDLVVAAREVSHSLGYHKKERGIDSFSQGPNHGGQLFWIIYFFEKSLSLRLGRTSTISEEDVTVPAPGAGNTSCPALSYCYIQVRLARLAGRIYSDLYPTHSLRLDGETRRASIEALSRDAHEIHDAVLANKTHFQQLGLYEKSKSWLDYIFTSDDIAHLSVLTMIHRAAPTWSPTQPFSDKCIAYAREAFAIHNSFDKSKSPILFSYMNWAILFLPFIPFFVLFCNVIEKGDRDDLKRLEAFVRSIKAASENPGLADHYRLFGAFYDAAQHYTDSRADLMMSRQTREELDHWMESYLNPLGLHAQVNLGQTSQSSSTGGDNVQLSSSASMSAADEGEGGPIHHHGCPAEQFPNMNWFGMNQQMMDTMNLDSS